MSQTPEETRRLAHLLRRAGFGARPDEWSAYVKLGVAGTTDRLLHPERVPDHLDDVFRDISGEYVDFNDMGSVTKWWLYRMAHSQRPLEEKMTLFWHNHFATANYKVDNPRWMWQQNALFRSHALGNFRTLLQAVSRDPAMLVWLDGAENRKGKPNENYGRELLELFTMGIGGGYTETDVKEAARAFTGWRFDRETATFTFDAERHDDGVKTFLGQTGNFNGDDIIDIVVRHPSTARFVCTKLFKFFAHDQPTPTDIASLTQTYFASGYDVRSVVGALLKSPVFYSEKSLFNKIKSPTEFVVTTLRTLDVPLTAAGGGNGSTSGTLRNMGQELFNPPNVKGWPEGQAWVNTMTMLTRINYANSLVNEMQRRGVFSGCIRRSLRAAGHGAGLDQPSAMVDAVWAALLPGHTPSEKTRGALLAFVSDNRGQARFEEKAPGLVSLILSAPEYQLA